jgi:hypothetical protein
MVIQKAKTAALTGTQGAALVTGYGSIGILVEALLGARLPHVQPGVITMAVTTLCHSAAEAWRGWLETTRGLRANQEATDVEASDITPKKENR